MIQKKSAKKIIKMCTVVAVIFVLFLSSCASAKHVREKKDEIKQFTEKNTAEKTTFSHKILEYSLKDYQNNRPFLKFLLDLLNALLFILLAPFIMLFLFIG